MTAPATPPTPAAADFVVPTHPWVPDQSDGTYRNPVLCADYSDPDVIRAGDDFWLTAAVEGKWIGVKVGPFAISNSEGDGRGAGEFHYFRFVKA